MIYTKNRLQYRYIFFLLVFFSYACKKNNTATKLQTLPAAQGTLVQLDVNQTPGPEIAGDFLGLSFEMTSITDSTYFNTGNNSFIQLVKNLSPGVLRIGANGVDKTFWCNHARTAATGADSIASTDIDRFSGFVNAIGWKVIFGLNLGGNFNAVTATSEAGYLYHVMPANLQSIEFGNEVDLYDRNGYRTSTYTSSDFENEWNQYYQAIHSAYPALAFSGPAVAYNKTWLSTFAGAEGSKVNLLSIHYYQGGPATDSSIHLNTLLSEHADSLISNFSNSVAAIAVTAQQPFRVAECNSIYDGGKNGVSNTFGATLWAVDYMWRLAYSGCQGVNFHGGGNGAYTPIGRMNGSFFPKPEYYSMLFFKDAGKGNVLPVSLNRQGLNISAYAGRTQDGTIYVSIVNKESQTPVAVELQPGMSAGSVTLEPLQAPSAEATEGISLAGKMINSDGSLTTSALNTYAVHSGSFTVNVPAASAMLVIVHP